MGRLLPLTVEKVDAIGAALRAGGYISHNNYLSRVFSEAERANAIVSPAAVRRAIKDANRACARGLGGLRQKSGLPLDQLHILPSGLAPWAEDGPRWPRDALVMGSWWLLRELEITGAAIHHATFFPGPHGYHRSVLAVTGFQGGPQRNRRLQNPRVWVRRLRFRAARSAVGGGSWGGALASALPRQSSSPPGAAR